MNAPHYNKDHNEYNEPGIKVPEFWNFDMIQATPKKVAPIVNGTGNKLGVDNV